jgi:mono/diheme cytochrome c family protein
MLLGGLLFALCGLSVAQKPKVANIPARHTSANAGKEMYAAYCAACHGKDGKGDGPVPTVLKARLAHFTILAQQNKGKFPSIQVANAISGGAGISAHGSKEMPTWGPVFMAMSHQHESEVHPRIANLTDYIKSLQQK